MNSNKILFVIYLSEKVKYLECEKYLEKLNNPNNMDIEIVSVSDHSGLAKAYNNVMNQSDAKFKVYLNDSTMIINKEFIPDTINLFKEYPEIGAMGMCGTKSVPVSLKWWESTSTYGTCSQENSDGQLEVTKFNEIVGEWEEVKYIGGPIIITQHDITWNEKSIEIESMVNVMHSIQLKESGLTLGVPKQIKPWFVYDKVLFEEWKEEELDSLLKAQSQFLPLVSILIPTYNRPDFFIQALESCLNQTYKNIEIIICDDSTNDETLLRVQPYLNDFPQIIYEKNEKNLGQFANDLKCIELAQGEFINFLMDDDLFHPQKIEKMIDYFIKDENEEIKLVTSKRQLIDSEGNFLEDWIATKLLFDEDTVIDGIIVGEFLLKNIINLIGEPTTVLFRKSALREPFGYFGNREYKCNVDLASWISMLSHGKMVYISESLSYFRIHSGQQLQSKKMMINGRIDFAKMLLNCNQYGYFLNNALDYREALENMWSFLKDIEKKVGYITFEVEYEEINQLLEEINSQILLCGKMYHSKEVINDSQTKIREDGLEGKNDHFDYNSEYKCFVRKGLKEVDYSDGSETYLLDVFKELKHIRSDGQNLIPYITDWSNQYHLSPRRNNLFDFIKDIFRDRNGSVLELGGGTGALTWWLAQHFNEVDVIEGSLLRAHVNALRNKEFENVNIYVDNLLNMKYPKLKYNVSTLIGVLEYIPYYSQSVNSYTTCVDFLSRLSDYMEDEGILVLAIENKLGAKYLSGCPEDHNSRLFSGILGYPESSAVTFSKKELQNMLMESGFENIQFYHCFPDYKFPNTIIKEGADMYNWNLGSVFRGSFPENGQQREFLMPDALLIESLASSQLLHELSNSFLVLCSKSKTTNLETSQSLTKYSNNDAVKPIFHHKINFLSENGQQIVERTPLFNNLRSIEIDHYKFNIRNESYINGSNLSVEAYRSILRKDNYSQLTQLIKELRRELLNKYGLEEMDKYRFYYVRGESLDFSLNNLIRSSEGKIEFIDQKWSTEERITEDFVVFRNLNSLFQEMHNFIDFSKSSEFVISIMSRIYQSFDLQRLQECYKRESLFQNVVNKKDSKPLDMQSDRFSKSIFMNR